MSASSVGIRKTILVSASIGLLMSPLAVTTAAGRQFTNEQDLRRQITFQPSLSVLEMTSFASTAFPATVPPPTPFPTPVMVPIEDDEYALAGDLLINGQAYPIGDELDSAEGITLGATEEGSFGEYGYAVIQDHPDYRLVWVNDENGERRHIIVHENDPLFAGEDGYRKHLEDLQEGMAALRTAAVPVVTAGGTLIAIGLGACAPTAGGGCALAFAGAVITGIVSLGAEAYIRLGVVDPAIDNLRADFETIAPNRGIDSTR